jgi:hypothetical protein
LSTSDWFLMTLTLEFSLSFTSMEPSCVQKEWTIHHSEVSYLQAATHGFQ